MGPHVIMKDIVTHQEIVLVINIAMELIVPSIAKPHQHAKTEVIVIHLEIVYVIVVTLEAIVNIIKNIVVVGPLAKEEVIVLVMEHVNVTGIITEVTVNTTNLGGACLTGILRMRKLKTKLWKLKTNKG